MSTHFLIDAFASPVSTAPIIGVDTPQSSQTLLNGAFLVRVPNNVALISPSTLTPVPPTNCGDLITKKYEGLLLAFPSFANIVYDDLLDTSGVNFSASPAPAGTFGQRSTIALNPGGVLTSNVQTLADTPGAFLFTWEVFTTVDTDPETSRFTRNYNELPTTGTYTTAQVSFNNGSNYIAATDSAVTSIPGADQSNQLIVQITNVTGSRLHIGSWALLY
jgi:hypothetical protein